AVGDRRGRKAAGTDIEWDVPPVVDRRRMGHPHLADDLRPHVKSRAGVAPRLEGEVGPRTGVVRVPVSGLRHGRPPRLGNLDPTPRADPCPPRRTAFDWNVGGWRAKTGRAPEGERAMTTIYTIGHSRHPADRFLQLLQANGVEILIDVRRKPWSRFNPQFNRERLAKSLGGA